MGRQHIPMHLSSKVMTVIYRGHMIITWIGEAEEGYLRKLQILIIVFEH
jgi:hypothetical protein